MSIPAEIQTELEMAQAARAVGNEGRARVCARRAAGLAARDFLNRQSITPGRPAQGNPRNSSAYETLQTLAAFPGLAPHLRQAALHLTMRVSGEFQLPAGIDLIAEANQLIGGLI